MHAPRHSTFDFVAWNKAAAEVHLEDLAKTHPKGKRGRKEFYNRVLYEMGGVLEKN